MSWLTNILRRAPKQQPIALSALVLTPGEVEFVLQYRSMGRNARKQLRRDVRKRLGYAANLQATTQKEV
jgi:hypothetical protein